MQLNKVELHVVSGADKGQRFFIEQPFVSIGTGADCTIRLSDPTISKRHLELRVTDSGIALRDLNSTNGTRIDGLALREALLTKPVEIFLGDTRVSIRATDDVAHIPLSRSMSFGDLVGQSDRMRHLFALLERAAKSDATILLEGESGTGKELAALAVHAHSVRADKPWIIVDCGALPENLVESELFGHVKGAFTGAQETRRGAFEEADGGTVFLDEIGEMPLAVQPKLLRFLERRELKPVGQNKHRKVDVRVLAATNRNLKEEAAAGNFEKISSID